MTKAEVRAEARRLICPTATDPTHKESVFSAGYLTTRLSNTIWVNARE